MIHKIEESEDGTPTIRMSEHKRHVRHNYPDRLIESQQQHPLWPQFVAIIPSYGECFGTVDLSLNNARVWLPLWNLFLDGATAFANSEYGMSTTLLHERLNEESVPIESEENEE